jgi:hypothetical protein
LGCPCIHVDVARLVEDFRRVGGDEVASIVGAVDAPTLVCVGALDPVTPV